MLLNVTINDITSRSQGSHSERGLILSSEEFRVCDQICCQDIDVGIEGGSVHRKVQSSPGVALSPYEMNRMVPT